MPFVQVPKDLTKVKTKIAFNLTKRQLICFGAAAIVGVPTSVIFMIGLMLPFFFLAMYEKDSQPAEKVIINYIRARIFFPRRRIYQTENLYAVIEQEGKKFDEKQTADKTGKTAERRKKSGKNK